mgnify:CR=1 FL=1
MSIKITTHARQRAEERLNWSTHTLERMIDRVFYFGIAAEHARGRVARYLEAAQDTADVVVRAYGEHLYVFAKDPLRTTIALVTVYEVPVPIRPLLRKHRLACAA